MFPKLKFNEDVVTMTPCFVDEALENEIHQQGDCEACLPKVERTYGKLIMPTGSRYPYIFSSIALSMDGKMAYPDNRDGDMLVHSNRQNLQGAEADFYVLNLLRAYSDAVLVGTTSMKAEANAWVTCHDMELVGERKERLGKREQPFVVVASRDGLDLPWNHMLFDQKELPVVVFTSPVGAGRIMEKDRERFKLMKEVSEEALWNLPGKGKNGIIATGTGEDTDIPAFMALMKQAGVDHLLNESPTFMWLLLRDNLMNEFFITHTSIFIGGDLTPGLRQPFTFEQHPESRIVRLNRHGNSYIYTRQLIRHAE